MAGYREVLFQLVGGRPAPALFHALATEPSARARLQAVSMGPDVVSVLIDYAGPAGAVARVRAHAQRPTPNMECDTLLDEDRHIRILAAWSRPKDASHGVSLEHLLYDAAGPSSLLFGRVDDGVITYKVASPGGRGISTFLARLQEAFGTRYTVRPLRAGPFRPGWEIEDTRKRVDPEDEALLAAALAAGYYDEPKRCGVRELGVAMGVSKSVVARRLRLLERRALEQLVS